MESLGKRLSVMESLGKRLSVMESLGKRLSAMESPGRRLQRVCCPFRWTSDTHLLLVEPELLFKVSTEGSMSLLFICGSATCMSSVIPVGTNPMRCCTTHHKKGKK